MSEQLRPELPELPARMRHLPARRGFPVPWFVAWMDNGVPVQVGEGEPDFRVVTTERVMEAVKEQRCWICGGRLGKNLSFVLGPMCAVNRNTSEPPCHLECADFAARACPFLVRPHARRNEQALPAPTDELAESTPGILLARNPGVALIWTTRSFQPRRDHKGGILFTIGHPEHVRWYCEARPATREEVKASIDSGLPALRELAEREGQLACRALEAALARSERWLPAASA